MSGFGNVNENWGGIPNHAHFDPNIFNGVPVTQVGHHAGVQTAGGFSATDPWYISYTLKINYLNIMLCF